MDSSSSFPSPYNPIERKTTDIMSSSRSATNSISFRNQRLYFGREAKVPSLYSQPSDSPLRPLLLRFPAASHGSAPNTPPLSSATISPPPPTSHLSSSLATKDRSLQFILNLYNFPNIPLNTTPDTSIADLLTLLRLKISSLPLESASIAESFSASLSTQPSNRFKDDCQNILTGYVGGLKQAEVLLSKVVSIGEDLIRDEENIGLDKASEEGTRTNRQIWWFVARTVLAQADQRL